MWIHLPPLFELINATTLARGLQLYRVQKVHTVELEPAPDGRAGHWRLSGDVQGSLREPYQVVVDLHLMSDLQTVDRWVGRCSCPVGSQCKHAVAMLIKAAYQGERMVGPGHEAAAPSATPKERVQQAAALEQQKKQAAELHLRHQQTLLAERWLLSSEHLPAAGHHPMSPPGLGRPRQTVMSPIYLLRLDTTQAHRPVLRIGLGASSIKVKGGWSKPRSVTPGYFRGGYSYNTFDLTERDHDILALLGALPSVLDPYRYGSPEDWRLDSVAAPLVLERAAGTGRLY